MVNQIERPKFPKPIRAAAIIETAHGVMLVQDIKDHFKQNTIRVLGDQYNKFIASSNYDAAGRKLAAMRIVSNGRFSLPGGKIERIDYITAGAEELLLLDRPPSTKEELIAFRDVVREAAIREVTEELGAKVDYEQVSTIIEIQGRMRDHVICVLRIEGLLELKHPEEISGIGFLNEENTIALNRLFYQAHVQKVMDRYVRKADRHRKLIPRFLSHLRVPKEYMDHWFENLQQGYLSRPKRYRNAHPVPTEPMSSPTFVILGEQNNVHNPYEPRSFTDNVRAKIVPPEVDPEKSTHATARKKKSEPPAPNDTSAVARSSTLPKRLEDISEDHAKAIMNASPDYVGDGTESGKK